MWYYEITVYMLHVWLDFIFPYFNWIALFMRKRKIIPSGLVVTVSNKMRIHMEKGSRTKPVKGNWTIKIFWSLVERRTEKNMEDYWCLACGGEWSNSASGEQWVQCIKCKDWAHESCTNESVHYVCDLCEMKW